MDEGDELNLALTLNTNRNQQKALVEDVFKDLNLPEEILEKLRKKWFNERAYQNYSGSLRNIIKQLADAEDFYTGINIRAQFSYIATEFSSGDGNQLIYITTDIIKHIVNKEFPQLNEQIGNLIKGWQRHAEMTSSQQRTENVRSAIEG